MQRIKQRRGGSINILEKGETANPQGRPKGSQNTATRMKKLFELKVKDINPLTKKEETFTGAELLDMALFKKALKGDVNAYREIMDRAEGKVVTTVQTNIEEDLAPRIKILFPTILELREMEENAGKELSAKKD